MSPERTAPSACNRHVEDLALLAGGDLADAAHEARLREHVDACAGCAGLLEELSGDRVLFALAAVGASTEDQPGVAGGVGIRLPAMAGDRPRTGRSRSTTGLDTHLIAFGRVAAAAVIVTCACVLGLALVDPGGEPAGTTIASSGSNSGAALPVFVRRSGAGVELTWAGDGRETSRSTLPPYRVLASASPRDFSGARPVEVAGHRLVAEMPLPAARRADRAVTYFRVE